jgi:hypothetical protein
LIAFIYECCEHGLVENVKAHKAVVPTVMKALTTHPQTEVLVERAVGIAILTDHPRKEALLRAALGQFGDSKFLRKYVSLITG